MAGVGSVESESCSQRNVTQFQLKILLTQAIFAQDLFALAKGIPLIAIVNDSHRASISIIIVISFLFSSLEHSHSHSRSHSRPSVSVLHYSRPINNAKYFFCLQANLCSI